MSKPTEAQIKKFLKWRGWEYDKTFDYWYPPGDVRDSAGLYITYSSPEMADMIDLNNLFKYAPEYQQIIFQPGYCGITIDDKLYEGLGDTEEDALFWAIWEVKEKSNG